MASKPITGRFFEDYRLGEVLPMRCRGRSRAASGRFIRRFIRRATRLYSSDEFARAVGLPASPLEDLATFHIVFGKTVPDVSLNAVANLGMPKVGF